MSREIIISTIKPFVLLESASSQAKVASKASQFQSVKASFSNSIRLKFVRPLNGTGAYRIIIQAFERLD